jgi:hypothetical protein
MVNNNLRSGSGLKSPEPLGANTSGFGSGFQGGRSMNLEQLMMQVLGMFIGNCLTGFLGSAQKCDSSSRGRTGS